jgi:hypothetical protein
VMCLPYRFAGAASIDALKLGCDTEAPAPDGSREPESPAVATTSPVGTGKVEDYGSPLADTCRGCRREFPAAALIDFSGERFCRECLEMEVEEFA